MGKIKIVVVSDNHGDVEILRKVRQLNNDADMFLHCGDSCLPPELIDGFSQVKGNCDYFDYPKSKTIKTEFGKIYFEHGHLHSLSDAYILSKDAVLFITGHTHIKKHLIISHCHVLNPGSLTRPRDGNNGTYLVIEYNDCNFNFYFRNI